MSERSHLLARTAENLAYAHVKVNILSLRMGRNISRYLPPFLPSDARLFRRDENATRIRGEERVEIQI
jgi:hypothetical protein